MTATCLHCKGDCRLTTGAEIYPHREDLADRDIWKCDTCDATVGCHRHSTKPLGFAADKATRQERMLLHDQMLDPLWLDDPDRRAARNRTYKFLARALGISRTECHTAHFDIETCRKAWKVLAEQTPETIKQWCDARADFAAKSRSDRQRQRHGKPKRKASRDTGRSIRGPLFCPTQAALDEVPW